MELVIKVRLHLIRLQVELCDVLHRRPRLHQPMPIGVCNTEWDHIEASGAFVDHLEFAVVLTLMNLVLARRQQPDLLDHLLAVFAIGNGD